MQSLNDDDSLTYSLSDESIDSKGGGDFYFSSAPSADFTGKKTKKRLNEVNKENETNSNEGNNKRMKTLPSTTMKVPPLPQFTTLKETAISLQPPNKTKVRRTTNKENETNSNEGNNERMKTLPSTTMKVPPLPQFATLKETAISLQPPNKTKVRRTTNKENETNSNKGSNKRMKTLPSTTMKVPPLPQFATLKETATSLQPRCIFFVCPQ
jgi:DNA-binding SARP family transcriptional activator